MLALHTHTRECVCDFRLALEFHVQSDLIANGNSFAS